MHYEFLQIIWFFLIAGLWIGFFFLEGFDFGVGMLLPFLGKRDEERRAIINTIGSVWDGNEVWLLTAGGATFAAFPHWYATMFSGFYLALFLLLVGLIIRGTSFANLSRGVPINQDMMFTGNLFTLLNPYGLLGGITTVSVFLLHGVNFLGLKLEGELHERVQRIARTIWAQTSLLYIGLGLYTYVAGFWAHGIVNPG